MTESQRPFVSADQQEKSGVVSAPNRRSLCAYISEWRAKRLLRRALRLAEEPILVLQISQAPTLYWSVLTEHRNRVILAASPGANSLQDDHRRLPGRIANQIKVATAPFDYSEIGSDSVDCVVMADIPPFPEWSAATFELLANLHRITRDTVIFLVRTAQQRDAAERSGEPARSSSSHSKSMENEFRRVGFAQLGHYKFAPGLDGRRLYVLRKEHNATMLLGV